MTSNDALKALKVNFKNLKKSYVNWCYKMTMRIRLVYKKFVTKPTLIFIYPSLIFGV